MRPLPKWLLPPLTSLLAGRERLHHALLITGPEGVGKEWLARALAAALLCDAPGAARLACGGCAGCRWFSQNSHPDFRLIRPSADEVSADDADAPAKATKASRDIRIEQIRALAGFVEIASHRGGAKVVLVTPAEAMNGAAANALLKTLEEPSPNTYFILVCSRIYRLPLTVRSRCRQVPIRVPSTNETISWVADQTGVDSDRALEWLAFCGGAPAVQLNLAWLSRRRRTGICLISLPAAIATHFPPWPIVCSSTNRETGRRCCMRGASTCFDAKQVPCRVTFLVRPTGWVRSLSGLTCRG